MTTRLILALVAILSAGSAPACEAHATYAAALDTATTEALTAARQRGRRVEVMAEDFAAAEAAGASD